MRTSAYQPRLVVDSQKALLNEFQKEFQLMIKDFIQLDQDQEKDLSVLFDQKNQRIIKKHFGNVLNFCLDESRQLQWQMLQENDIEFHMEAMNKTDLNLLKSKIISKFILGLKYLNLAERIKPLKFKQKIQIKQLLLKKVNQELQNLSCYIKRQQQPKNNKIKIKPLEQIHQIQNSKAIYLYEFKLKLKQFFVQTLYMQNNKLTKTNLQNLKQVFASFIYNFQDETSLSSSFKIDKKNIFQKCVIYWKLNLSQMEHTIIERFIKTIQTFQFQQSFLSYTKNQQQQIIVLICDVFDQKIYNFQSKKKEQKQKQVGKIIRSSSAPKPIKNNNLNDKPTSSFAKKQQFSNNKIYQNRIQKQIQQRRNRSRQLKLNQRKISQKRNNLQQLMQIYMEQKKERKMQQQYLYDFIQRSGRELKALELEFNKKKLINNLEQENSDDEQPEFQRNSQRDLHNDFDRSSDSEMQKKFKLKQKQQILIKRLKNGQNFL